MAKRALISIVVPAYNEAPALTPLYQELSKAIKPLPYDFELIFVDDGSTDKTLEVIKLLQTKDPRVRIIELVRNFSKEIATTAGLHATAGQAAITIDADLQHPPDLIPEFLALWEKGAELVVGVRKTSHKSRRFKNITSHFFYRSLNLIADTDVKPFATDFRLLDRTVIDEFNRFTERHRMTRGLIDWLGFKPEYIHFSPPPRTHGQASYSYRRLLNLATNAIVGHSFFPLKIAGYLGVFITLLSSGMGSFIFINKFVLHDPQHYHFSGPAVLGVVTLFLVGIILICLGLIGLYIGNIHSEVINRPLYIVRRQPKARDKSTDQ